MSEMTGTQTGESPLVPNRTMQRMYQGMVESRMLADLQQTKRGKAKTPSTYGQEACRAAALVDLTPNDFSSDHSGLAASALLRGVELQTLVTASASHHGKKKNRKGPDYNLPGLLPDTADIDVRLHLALGAALAAKRLKTSSIVVVFAGLTEAKPSLWRDVLQFAAQEQLSMLFVALPSVAKKKTKAFDPFELSSKSTALGVPGIPVDASDAIALYRVAQESIGRARAGGGSALMECMRINAAGLLKGPLIDPVPAMGAMLLKRGVCDERWLTSIAPAFQARLDSL